MQNLYTIFTSFYLFTMIATTASAQELSIAPYKDELFNYSATLETRNGGAFEMKDYDEMRDVNGRDEIPVEKSLPQYVDETMIGMEHSETLKARNFKVDYLEVGSKSNAAFVVIFAHGANGTKELGMKDWTFGGNFNRLKHFAVAHNGTYISPSFVDFGQGGAAQIRLLVQHVREVSPKAKIILACASSGGSICESAFRQEETLAQISGFVLMATGAAPTMFNSPMIHKYNPAILLSHGTNDKLVRYESYLAAFETFQTANPEYPVRFQLYNQGGHGTPIRMIDWRETLNWIFANAQ